MKSVPTVDAAFGRSIYMAMFDQRITQTKLAAALGISQSTLSKKLRGETAWSLSDAIGVADALGVDLRGVLTHMWGDTDNDITKWAPRGSNPEPTDYKSEGSARVVSLAEHQARRNSAIAASA